MYMYVHHVYRDIYRQNQIVCSCIVSEFVLEANKNCQTRYFLNENSYITR